MAEGRMNLAALQQRDPYITDIVDTASQVALYSFNSKTSEWEKTEIEGSLFVYKRSASPTHGFMILNRLGLTNQIEPITKELEFQLQDPFLLYRNSKAIYGIWFYDQDECARIGQMMNSFLQVAIESHTTAQRNRRASESDSMHDIMSGATRQVNILQMLSKAQDEYVKVDEEELHPLVTERYTGTDTKSDITSMENTEWSSDEEWINSRMEENCDQTPTERQQIEAGTRQVQSEPEVCRGTNDMNTVDPTESNIEVSETYSTTSRAKPAVEVHTSQFGGRLESPQSEERPATQMYDNKPDSPQSEERVDSPPSEVRPDSHPSEERPDSHPSEERQNSPQSEERPDSPQSEERPDLSQSKVRPDSHPSEERPDSHPSDERPDSHPSEERPNSPQSEERPDLSQSKVRPDSHPSEERPDSHPSDERPDSHPSGERPDSHPSEERPDSPQSEERPNSPQSEERPDLSQSKVRPDSHPSEERPDSHPSDERPDSHPSGERPDSHPSEERPDSPQSEERPDSPQSEERPDSPQSEERPDLSQSKVRPDSPPSEERPDSLPSEERPDSHPSEERPDSPQSEERPDVSQSKVRPDSLPSEERSGSHTSVDRPESRHCEERPDTYLSGGRQYSTDSMDTLKSNGQLDITPLRSKRSKQAKQQAGKAVISSSHHKRSRRVSTKSMLDDESNDDNIPLSFLTKNRPNCMSDVESIIDREDSYKLTKEDINSSESNLSSVLSEVGNSDTDSEHSTKMSSCKIHVTATPLTEHEIIQTVKEVTKQHAYPVEHIRKQCEQKLDDILTANGLERIHVSADGDCFFRAAKLHFPKVNDENDLRRMLCEHIIDYAGEYICFFSNNNVNESYEEDIIWIDFRTEVEELKHHGKWTNRTAGLLPLALANWSKKPIRIFSSLSTKPVMDILPTVCPPESSASIFLAYLTTENDAFPSHYDGCVKIETVQNNANLNDFNKKVLVAQHVNVDCEEEIVLTNTLSDQPIVTPSKSKKKPGRPKGTSQREKLTYITPLEKKLFRKRKSTPEDWKKNVRKRLRLSGKEYISQSGKTIPKRALKPVDCNKCKYKCSDNVTEEDRMQIFNTFWSLDSSNRKKDFVISRIEEKKTRKYINPNNATDEKRKRDIYRTYSFDVNGDQKIVCKKFFKSTLDVGDAFIDNAMRHESGGVYAGVDKRGQHAPHNKTKTEDMQRVREHIESFPAVKGHYTRRHSNRKYLGAELNIKRMYQLYQEHCKENNYNLVSLATYRKTFNEEYNYSFHIPKKDQCNIDVIYAKGVADGSLTEEEKEKYNEHHQLKIQAREEKKNDKDIAKSSMNVFVATLDLQAVLQTPCSLSKSKPDPKPFIDNPNASATKSSDLIRPRPVKAMAEESGVDQIQSLGSSSGTLTLETLFRNASMQQSQKVRSQTSVVETSKPPPAFHRSVSVTETRNVTESEDSQDVPALLKHIMSSGSMVEEIERQQRGELPSSSLSLSNGGSYKTTSKSQKDISHILQGGDSDSVVAMIERARFSLSDSASEFGTKSVMQDLTDRFGDALPINRLSDSVLKRASPSENVSRQSESGLQVLGSVKRRSPASENLIRQADSGLPGIGRVSSAELLTPAALEKSSSSVSSSEKASTTSTKQLSAAAASLQSNVLLSPMAFVRGSQKSPASSLSDEPGRLNRSNDSGSSQEGSTSLPVAALTKEQLQQAIVHLMKTDPSFINTLHEAYLNSLKELSKS